MEAEDLFEKKFEFLIPVSHGNRWTQPPMKQDTCALPAESNTLTQLKHELNQLKRSLNEYDITEWNKHTCDANPSGFINSHIRNYCHPELCTQAWCKFHEMLCFDEVVPFHAISSKVVNAVHICEAPGAFICSLNHFLRSQFKKIQYRWVGCTLNPYYEGHHPNSCIPDDRLIFHTLHNWCFGQDDTGDVFSSSTLRKLSERTSVWGRVDVVTADGSVNCQEKPEDQEIDTAALKYTELLYALNLLSPGGSFVLKMFTMFERTSICLLHILCSIFSSVSIRKPATSKPGNSEVYITAKGFLGKGYCEELVYILTAKFPFKDGSDLEILSGCTIPPQFMTQHEECVNVFVNFQMDAIRRNVELYKTEFLTPELEEHKRIVARHAIDVMQIGRIQKNQCLLKSGILRGHTRSHVQLRPKLEGTFAGRLKVHAPKPDDGMRHQNDNYVEKHEPQWRSPESTSVSVGDMDLVFGKPLSTIQTSLFCNTEKLMALHEIWMTCGVDGKGCDIANPVTRMFHHALLQLLSSGNVQAYEPVTGLSFSHVRQILTEILGDPLTFEIKNLNKKTYSEVTKDSVVLVSLITRDSCSGSFRELLSCQELITAADFMFKCLQPGASAVFLLPSALTRLSAGVLWLLSQSFESYSISTTGSCSTPGLYLICRKFLESCRWVRLLERAVTSMTECNEKKTLLGIVPVKILLHDEAFSSSLKSCNHQILNLRLLRKQDFVL